jgi:hypothetical protein
MTALFEKGREGFLDGSIDWDTDTIKAMLLDLGTADVGVKAITGATNPGNPIVITATGHGFANGDIVLIDGVGGNLAANGIWKIANQAANTFELQTLAGVNATGSGAYTSGGVAVCLGPSAAGDFLDDFSAARVSTDQTLGSKTATAGVADAADISFPGWASTTVEAIAIYKDTGAEGTSRMIYLSIGKILVKVASDAASSATTLWVEPLEAGIPNGSAIVFSNGVTATLSGAASEGARSLSVSALPGAIAAGHQALAPATGSGLPVTGNGNALNVAWPAGANRIFKL